MNNQMEEMYGARCERRWVELPWPLGCTTLLAPPPVQQPGCSQNPIWLKFYGRLITYIWSIINSIFSPSPSWREWGVGAKNSKLLIVALSFRWPAPQPGTIQEPTALEQKTLLVHWKLQRFWERCVRSWGQRPMYLSNYKSRYHNYVRCIQLYFLFHQLP